MASEESNLSTGIRRVVDRLERDIVEHNSDGGANHNHRERVLLARRFQFAGMRRWNQHGGLRGLDLAGVKPFFRHIEGAIPINIDAVIVRESAITAHVESNTIVGISPVDGKINADYIVVQGGTGWHACN